MQLSQINPFVRFAAAVQGDIRNEEVKVTDCRIFYLEEGCLRIYIQDRCCQMEKNSLFYCCGGSTYRVEAEKGAKLLSVNFDLSRDREGESVPFAVCTAGQWAQMPVYAQQVADSPFLNGHLLLSDALWLHEELCKLMQEHRNNTPLSSLLCGSMLKTLLLRLHQDRWQELPPKLALVRDYIQNHYREDLTNEKLGAVAGYHPYHLNRSFKGCTGMTLHEYLLKVRLQQAASLILNTTLPLSVIAEQVGMRVYPHFSACFKSCYGCAPAQYRSRYI